MSITSVRAWFVVVAVVTALASANCGSVEPTPTSPSPTPAPAPAPAPAPSPSPAPGATAAAFSITILPSNPVPFSGVPITDVASCQGRNNTWYYDQVVRETAGVAATITERFDQFDGVGGTKSNPTIQIAAGGSTTITTRWCSSTSSEHKAQTNFSGTDAKGNTWSLNGPVVRLLANK